MKFLSTHAAFSGLKALALISIAALGFTSCGGGGGGDDDSPPTVRPKSLDAIYMTLDNNVRFEFVRNAGTPGAVNNGDIETGAFIYLQGGVQRRTYPNTDSDFSDTRYPDAINSATYSYRAINNNAGVITLRGVGVNDLTTTGTFNALNGSFVYLFNTSSVGQIINEVEVDVTFSDSGVVFTDFATVRIPGSTSPYDEIRVPVNFQLVSGGSVPINYNPVVDPNRPSRIAPEFLGQPSKRIDFTSTNGNGDFSVDFTSDSSTSSGSSTTMEVGSGLLRVNGSVVVNAVNFTWTRIGGTDNGRLVISDVPVTVLGGSLNGEYLLRFVGTQTGEYDGTLDADTTDIDEVSGDFTVTDNP